MRCVVCAKQEVVSCMGLLLCIDHQMEFLDGSNTLISKYGFGKFLEENGYRRDMFTRKWIREELGEALIIN